MGADVVGISASESSLRGCDEQLSAKVVMVVKMIKVAKIFMMLADELMLALDPGSEFMEMFIIISLILLVSF